MKALLKDCPVCGYVHVDPKPEQKELEKMYKNTFYDTEKPGYVENYRNDADWWFSVYKERLEFVGRKLNVECGRVLDVGSGTGLFLEAGRKLGWDVVGVEPSRSNVEFNRSVGLDVIEGFFDQNSIAKLRDKEFDFVHTSQVLEHVLDPLNILSLSQEVLSDEGLICVVVPNDFNDLQLALRDNDGYAPWWVVPKHHINYFSFDSLRKLLHKAGYQVVHETTTFPMEIFLMMGDNYVGNDELGRACHKKRMRMEMLMNKAGLSELKSDMYEGLAKLGIGREIVMYAKKA